jgi:hypothetical protein
MKGLGFVLLLAVAVPAAAAPEAPIVVLANADGVLDLAGAIQAQTFDAIPNPFRNRYHPAPQIREVPLAITAVLIGRPPAMASAIVNGQLYSAGDKLEGLTVAAITAEGLDLRQDAILVRVPVQPLTPRLRLLR